MGIVLKWTKNILNIGLKKQKVNKANPALRIRIVKFVNYLDNIMFLH